MSKHQQMYESFAARVERFIKRHKIAPSRLGRDAVQDQNFVFDMRRGVCPRPERMDRIEEFMRDYKSRAAPAAQVHAAE